MPPRSNSRNRSPTDRSAASIKRHRSKADPALPDSSLQSPRRQNVLSAISSIGDDEHTPQDVALAYLKRLCTVTCARSARVYFRNEETRRMEPLAVWGERNEREAQACDRLVTEVAKGGTANAVNGEWVVPMKRKRTLEGVLALHGVPDKMRNVRQIRELVESAVSRLAFALVHVRLTRKYAQKIERIQRLEDVSAILTAPLSQQEQMERTLEAATRLVDAEAASLLLWDEQTGDLVFAAVAGERCQALKGMRLASNQGIAGLVARKGTPVIINDAQDNPRVDREFDRMTGITTRNLLVVPIRTPHRTLGIMEAVNKREGRAFGNWDLLELASLSHQMAIALENARLLRNSQGTISRLRKLQEVSEVLNSSLKQSEIRKRAIEAATVLMNAEAGSLLLLDETAGELYFEVALGEKGDDVREIRLKLRQGIAGYVAKTGEPLIVNDAQNDPRFSNQADKKSGFTTRNMVCVPVKAREKLLGVLQAINKHDGCVFDQQDLQDFISLGHQVGIAIENANLYEEINHLFEGFISASVLAIESRDPTTSGHSGRVATLTCGLAEAVDRCAQGPLASLTFDHDQIKEIRYAAVLHDFGKVGVREHVLVKAQKLFPGDVALLKARFDFIKQSWEVRALRRKVDLLMSGDRVATAALLAEMDEDLAKRISETEGILNFLLSCNQPTVLPQGGFERLHQIAGMTYDAGGETRPYLTPEEVITLSIPKGSLTVEERLEIQSHVIHTYRFLSTIPWTKTLKNVPIIAYGHHETLDGTGYPRGVLRDTIPLQTRMMTVCDIYDALTASDRPYKASVSTTEALEILDGEVKQGKVDPHLFEVFVDAKIYRRV